MCTESRIAALHFEELHQLGPLVSELSRRTWLEPMSRGPDAPTNDHDWMDGESSEKEDGGG
jgi:hypothetical protein